MTLLYIQWNSSNLDTIGPEESVLISEVSLFQGLKSTQTWYLGRKKVFRLERCPYFRGDLIDGYSIEYMYNLYMYICHYLSLANEVVQYILNILQLVYPHFPLLTALIETIFA